ncbi:MAG: RusA family crossover junction endodeoxyribonuclease [Candidatus Omnitrophota bacterium]
MGNNPFMGEFKRAFNFPPVPNSNKSKQAREKFKEKLRAEIKTNFVYTHEIRLTITLYFDEERRLETSKYADLDNYAKSICDAIKGRGGIIIDDCQIQQLCISWIDHLEEPRFEIKINSGPDDFCSKDLALYEMDDGLFYPVPNDMNDCQQNIPFYFLKSLSNMISLKKKFRHSYRQKGMPQYLAYQRSTGISPILWGFHKTRIIDSGFSIIAKAEWTEKYESWKSIPENKEIVIALERETKI